MNLRVICRTPVFAGVLLIRKEYSRLIALSPVDSMSLLAEKLKKKLIKKILSNGAEKKKDWNKKKEGRNRKNNRNTKEHRWMRVLRHINLS